MNKRVRTACHPCLPSCLHAGARSDTRADGGPELRDHPSPFLDCAPFLTPPAALLCARTLPLFLAVDIFSGVARALLLPAAMSFLFSHEY